MTARIGGVTSRQGRWQFSFGAVYTSVVPQQCILYSGHAIYACVRKRALQTSKCPYLPVSLTVPYIIGPLNRRRRLLFLLLRTIRCPQTGELFIATEPLQTGSATGDPSIRPMSLALDTGVYVPPGGRSPANRAKSPAKFRCSCRYVGCTCRFSPYTCMC